MFTTEDTEDTEKIMNGAPPVTCHLSPATCHPPRAAAQHSALSTQYSALNTQHSALSTQHSPRGSVLVFAVIILSLLAMLGTTFILIIRQSSRASSNVEKNIEAEQAVKSGLEHARGALRAMARGTILSRDGVFDPSGGTYKYTNIQYWAYENDPAANPAPPAGTSSAYAKLESADPAEPVLYLDPAATTLLPRFTTSPLRCGAPDYLGDGSEHARQHEIQGATNSIYPSQRLGGAYPPKGNLKELARLGSVRGEYYVWILDFDGKLNVNPVPTRWTGTPPPALWGIEPPKQADAEAIQSRILEELADSAGNPLLSADDIAYVLTPPASPYSSMQDFAQTLPTLVAGYDPLKRGEIDLRLTTDLDLELLAKTSVAGLNINTAPVEIITAALSQIPAYDAADPNATFGSNGLASRLAARIVAKRPFLCRMDFEDFAAAHLEGAPTDTNTPWGAVRYAIGFRGDPVNPASDRTELDLHQYLEIPGFEKFGIYEGMMGWKQMLKRFDFFAAGRAADDKLTIKEFNNLLNSVSRNNITGRGAQSVGGGNRQVTPPGARGVVVIHPNENLTISSVLSLGGDDFKGKIIKAGGNGDLDSILAGDDERVEKSGDEFIGAGTDGVLQSIPAGDDVSSGGIIILAGNDRILQSVPAGDDQRAGGPYISPGADMTLQTTRAGDDLPADAVLSGPNGIAETSIFGFSYYSHDTVPPDYKPIWTLTNNPTAYGGDPANLAKPAYVGKFVYGALATNYAPADSNYKNYRIADLKQWSCIGNGERSGYYDFFFNPGDVMLKELGEELPPSPPAPAPPSTEEPVVQPMIGLDWTTTDPVLRTGWGSDDWQEVDGPQPGPPPTQGDPVIIDPVVVSPGLNGALETAPAPDDVTVQAIGVGSSSFTSEMGDDVWVNSSSPDWFGFILAGPNLVFDTTPTPPDPPDQLDTGDRMTYIIVDGSSGYADTNVPPNDDYFFSDPAASPPEFIAIGENVKNDTSVWGPLRASQRPQDQKTPRRPTDPAATSSVILNQDQVSSAVFLEPDKPPVLGGPKGDGDVSWSPQFSFRSRFFGIYVLGRGLARGWIGPEKDPPGMSSPPTTEQKHLRGLKDDGTVWLEHPLKVMGERRLEAVYDAFNDEIIWQRAPLTDKRSLSEP